MGELAPMDLSIMRCPDCGSNAFGLKLFSHCTNPGCYAGRVDTNHAQRQRQQKSMLRFTDAVPAVFIKPIPYDWEECPVCKGKGRVLHK